MPVPDAITDVLDAASPVVWAAAGAGLITLLLALLAVWRARRRGRADERPAPTPTPVSAAEPGRIRRPVYIDPLLLDDLLAHAEPHDFSRPLRTELEGDDLEGRTAETRKLNKALAGLTARELLIDLDEEADAPLVRGRAVRVTGALTEQPASDVAQLLELSSPVLVHHGNTMDAGSPNGDRSDRAARGVAGQRVEDGAARIYVLDPPDGRRRFLCVLHPEGMRASSRSALAETVTVLGVCEEVLSRSDRLPAEVYLPDHLSPPVRQRLEGADLGEVAASVTRLAGREVKPRQLTFSGPGARLTVAAIYR